MKHISSPTKFIRLLQLAIPAAAIIAYSAYTAQAAVTIGSGISFIQGAKGSPASFVATPTSGNTVLVSCYSGAAITSVTDNQANTYTKIASQGGGSGNTTLSVYYASNIRATGKFTVTCNTSGLSQTNILEYSGISGTTPVDASAGASGWSNAENSGNLITTAPSELLVGFVGSDGSGAFTAGTGFVSRVTTTANWPLATEDKLTGVAGSYFANMKTGSATSWRVIAVAFVPGTSTPSPVASPSPVPTSSPTVAPTPTPVPSPTPTPTPSLSPSPVASPSPSPVPSPSPSPVPTPSVSPVAIKAMPVISRNVPAFASSTSGSNVASNANSGIYDVFDYHSWRSASLPAWLAYDLSAVPETQRGMVDVAWYNNAGAYQYSIAAGGSPVGLPKNYTIEANVAPGGTAAPVDNWVVLATVTGNIYQSRQQVIDLTGYNWVRINITSVTGGTTAMLMHMDVHDLSQSAGQAQDSWIFYGDSITLGATNYQEYYDGSPDNFTIAQLINAQYAQYFPAQEDGGVVGASITDAVNNIDAWLAVFPGKFVDISYGTNDLTGGMTADAFYANYATVIQKVIAAGKTPVVPKIPWGKVSSVQTKGPSFNAKIDQLYVDYPQIIKGPDFWTFFVNNPGYIGAGDVHPNSAGYGEMRKLWAQNMIQNVYAIQ